MLAFVYDTLNFTRKAFPRKTPWLFFCMVVIGFIGATEMVGVTSICRFWGGGEPLYKSLLHFFRVSNWSLNALVVQWISFVLAQNLTIKMQGRAVLLGDHTFVPKDGRKMPGVVSLRQNSETQSKPSYFRGHCWGAIGLLIGSVYAPFCLPLILGIHLGTFHIGQAESAKKKPQTMGTKIVQMAIDTAFKHNLPSILVLDAFFPGSAVFNLAASVWSIELQQPLVTLIIRGKKNCVAYFEAEKSQYKGRGRYPKYGDKVKLMELFDQLHLFKKARCNIYGRPEEILFACLDLLWKPTGGLIRFVLAITSRGPIILMCSDLKQDPIVAIKLYCLRPRIEVMFDMLKNLIGAFRYRFWSGKMPRHSRKPVKNKFLKKASPQNIKKVKKCWDGYERFVMCGAIALGILELIAYKFTELVWDQFNVYIRTKSRYIPSERTVKHVITNLLTNIFRISPKNGIMWLIKEQFRGRISRIATDSCSIIE